MHHKRRRLKQFITMAQLLTEKRISTSAVWVKKRGKTILEIVAPGIVPGTWAEYSVASEYGEYETEKIMHV